MNPCLRIVLGALAALTLPAQAQEATPTPAPEPPSRCRIFYPDCDGDGFTNPNGGQEACSHPNLDPEQSCRWLSVARLATDCDDTNPAVHPRASEGEGAPGSQSDGLDNDCDGVVDLDCDGTSGNAEPRIEVRSPTRGSFTTSGDVLFTGVVYPSRSRAAVSEVWVGGQAAALSACGGEGGRSFSASLPLETGLGTVEVIARDEAGGLDVAQTSILRADQFSPPSSQPVRGALNSLLNQGSWDILADYLESYYSAAEVQAQLLAANPIINDSGDDDCLESWRVYAEATGYSHDDFQVTFTVTGGRVRATARLIHPQMWATGYGYYDLEWYCGGWSDTVYMNGHAWFSEVNAAADGALWIDGNGVVQVAFSNVSADAVGAGLAVSADDWLYDWLIDLFEDALAEEMESFIEDELRSYIANDLGPDLAAELNELDLSYTVAMGDISYGVRFDYDTLAVVEGSVPLGMKMSLSYAMDGRTPSNPGALVAPLGYQLATSPTFGFRIGHDFFNSSLHALWEGGSLYLDEQLLADPVIIGAVTPLLPPVISAGTDGWLAELALGDVLLSMDIQEPDGTLTTVEVALSARVDLDIDTWASSTQLGFDATFGEVSIGYDPLGADPIPQAWVDASELAMAAAVGVILEELEIYLESLYISTLGVPMTINNLTTNPDAANPSMIAIDGWASYTGP